MIYRFRINKETPIYNQFIGDAGKSMLDAGLWISRNSTNETYDLRTCEEGAGRTLREDSKLIFRGPNGEEECADFDDADSKIALLSDDDGYDLIDLEQPVGSKPSILLEARPSFNEVF